MSGVLIPLTVRDLLREDLGSCSWSGGSWHVAHVAEALERRERGEVAYLAVCPPSNVPVAIGGVDFVVNAGAGTLWQLAVHPALRSCGIGSALINAAEHRILDRGLDCAELGVEESNPRALALYERLGYVTYGTKPEEWDAEAPDGSIFKYRTVCIRMRKKLQTYLAGP